MMVLSRCAEQRSHTNGRNLPMNGCTACNRVLTGYGAIAIAVASLRLGAAITSAPVQRHLTHKTSGDRRVAVSARVRHQNATSLTLLLTTNLVGVRLRFKILRLSLNILEEASRRVR